MATPRKMEMKCVIFRQRGGEKSQSDKRQVWRKTNNKTREKRNVKQGNRNKPRQKRDHRWVG